LEKQENEHVSRKIIGSKPLENVNDKPLRLYCSFAAKPSPLPRHLVYTAAPSSLILFSRVSGLATPFPEMMRETVDFETPALNAMSLMV
jgi:hypothetical protein